MQKSHLRSVCSGAVRLNCLSDIVETFKRLQAVHMAKRLCYSGYKNPADVGSLSEFADTVFGNGYELLNALF